MLTSAQNWCMMQDSIAIVFQQNAVLAVRKTRLPNYNPPTLGVMGYASPQHLVTGFSVSSEVSCLSLSGFVVYNGSHDRRQNLIYVFEK
jgi:hypothetical protein